MREVEKRIEILELYVGAAWLAGLLAILALAIFFNYEKKIEKEVNDLTSL